MGGNEVGGGFAVLNSRKISPKTAGKAETPPLFGCPPQNCIIRPPLLMVAPKHPKIPRGGAIAPQNLRNVGKKGATRFSDEFK